MDTIKIACPDCKSKMAQFGFQGESFVRLESYKIQGLEEKCVTKIEDKYSIRCSKATCQWSKHRLELSFSNLIKLTFQALREQIDTLVLISEDLKPLLKEYETNPSEVLEWSVELYKSGQVEKIGSLPPESGRRGRRKAQAKSRQALAPEH